MDTQRTTQTTAFGATSAKAEAAYRVLAGVWLHNSQPEIRQRGVDLLRQLAAAA